ncbi:uncharacterized protein LOC129952612 [Eupeodes corollae]|uniref:uncharacterized protein LOC129952612 n=1 Tax=Eupeodes corollae TaxID=290404 RepID=UPI00248FBE3E|nr:uncharacterized protein LOC129952612 [Eupeodes corollae]
MQMLQQVRLINRSLGTCKRIQLRSITQLNVKGSEENHEEVFSQEWLNAKPTTAIPGPSVFGMIRGFMPGGEYYKMSLNDFTAAGRKKYGDIFKVPSMFGKPSMLMCFNPDDFPVFLHSEGVWPNRVGIATMNYHRTVHRKDDYGDVIGILGSNGETWGKIRSSVNPILMKSQNSRLYLGKMQEVSSEFIERIRDIRDPRTMEVPGTFFDEINRLTFESVAVVALNKQVGLIRKNRDNEEAVKIFDSLRNIFDLTLDLDMNPSLWRFIRTPKFVKMMKSYDTLHDIIMKHVNEALERIESEKSSSNDNDEKSVLEKLLKVDRKVAIVMAIDMLMAGVDTTSSTIAGNLLCLAKNPDKQKSSSNDNDEKSVLEKLLKVDRKVAIVMAIDMLMAGVDTTSSTIARRNSMKSLPYLRACLKEGMRIYPVSPGFPRSAGDNIVLSGYRVPKNQHVLLNSNVVMLEDQYVPNAKHYLPERWLRNEKSTKGQINPFMFIPFGFGPRSCVGKRIVEMELETTIARLPILIQTFRRNLEIQTKSAECPHKAAITEPSTDWENARPFNEIPGPTKFEIIRGFMPGGDYYKKPVTDFFNALRQNYGDFLVLPGMFGKKAIIMTYDPNIFRDVFRNEGIWPSRRNFDSAFYYRNVYKKEYFRGNEGLIMTSGESWGKFRTAVNPILMQPKNAKQYLTKMIPVNNEFLQRIREIRDPNTLEMPENFLDEINRLTFESVAVIALDQELGFIRKNRDAPEVAELFRSLNRFFDLAYELDIQPSIWKIIKTPKFYEMMRVNDKMFNITKKFIDDALERFEKNPNSEDDNYQKSVVEKLAEKDKLVAVVMAMDMMLAGVDTTTTTLTGTLFGIAKNPEKQEKLRKEIRSILPKKDSVPTLESMKNLPYLRASIKEGIRLYPIGPGTVRTMPKDIVLNGYQIPMNTDVAMANNYILKESKYFPQPEEFIPERWLRTEEGDAFKADEVNPFVYLPFGFGPRSCAGKRIVDLELELTVMRLVRNFNIEFNYSIENAFDTQFITRPAIPLKFKFSEIND